ncbi:MAG: hypothetical protein J5999_10200 [Oscillospiraceae bacterium]|nr:hypothetical protein [Oscillospiraceae bacterium]
MKKIKIDFNPFNHSIMRETLNEQLSQGFKLKKVGAAFGTLSFVPVEDGEKIVYEIARYEAYEDGLNVPEPWISCGRVGGAEIFRFDGDGTRAVPEFPKESGDPEKNIRKKRRGTLILGIADTVLALCYAVILILDLSDSVAAFVQEATVIRLFPPVCFLFVGISYICQYFDNPYKKAASDNRRGKWFNNFVLPWIVCVSVLAAFFVGLAVFDIGEQPALPDERLPFSENAEYGTVERSMAGDIYRYDNAFLYDVCSESLAERLFEEAKAGNSSHKGEWRKRRFGNVDIHTEISAEKYANIDRILSCTEDSEYYELTYNGVIVLCGDRLFGYLYEKEEFTEEEILSEINNFYERTD